MSTSKASLLQPTTLPDPCLAFPLTPAPCSPRLCPPQSPAPHLTPLSFPSLPLSTSRLSYRYNYFVSCAEHAEIGAPHVPVLNLLSANDPFFGPNQSVAAKVATPGAGGYGSWPLQGSCAPRMRAQQLAGAAFRMTQAGMQLLAVRSCYKSSHWQLNLLLH